MPEVYEKNPFLKVRIIENCTTSLFINFLGQHMTANQLNFYLANVDATNR